MEHPRASLAWVPRAAGCFAFAGGALVLVGWMADSHRLKTLFLDGMNMAPNAALGFLLLGWALAAGEGEGKGPWIRSAAVLVALLGGLTLAEFLFRLDLGLDRLLFRVSAPAQAFPGRMAALSAVNFLTLGVALILPLRWVRISLLLAVPAVLFSLLALVGHGYGAPLLYGPVGRSLMALPTALIFFLLSLGFLVRFGRSEVEAAFGASGLEGFLVRRFLPVLLLLPPGLGWLRLKLERAGYFSNESSAALFTVTYMLLFLSFGAWALSSFRRLEAGRRAAEQASRQAEAEIQRFQHIVKEVPIGLTVYHLERFEEDESLRFHDANPAAVSLLKLEGTGALGRLFVEAFPAMKGHPDLHRYAEVVRTGVALDLGEVRYGDDRLAESIYAAKAFPLPGQRVGIAFENVTDQVRARNMKDEFVSLVSHELRTPLTSIRGAVGLLASGAVGELSIQARPLMEIASQNCDRLSRLINDILDLEKIQTGKLDYRQTLVNPEELLRRAIEAHSPYAAQFAVHFDLEALPPGARFRVDPDRLLQVLANLLSNAVKFSPRGGTVGVRLLRADGRLRIEVQDQGEGIPAAFRERIFEKFAQADASATRSKGGSGLGLSIAKAMVEAMDGQIGFESEPGRGSIFFVEFPEWSLATFPPGTPRILVVEDDPDVGALLVLLLAHEGLDAEVAASAEDAKEKLALGTYAALTLDLLLPGQGGLALMQDLRAQPSTRDLPIVVISAHAAKGRQELKGQALGVVEWLDKPIAPDRLSAAVRVALGKGVQGKARVLHVEGDRELQEIVATTLQGMADVQGADNLKDALASLERRPPDLVILDPMLSDGHGFELLADLPNPGGRPVPVIVYSGQELSEEAALRVEAAFLKSNIPVQEMLKVIQELVRPFPH